MIKIKLYCQISLIVIITIVVLMGLIIIFDKPDSGKSVVSKDLRRIHFYSGVKECDDKIGIFYDELLKCLKFIDHPELLDRSISDDVNKVDQCYGDLNWDTQVAGCFYQSNYRFIDNICSLMIGRDDHQDAITRRILQALCIKSNQSLIDSGVAIVNFRKQFDGSSFTNCYGNGDCPSDEFCSIQGVQRCEKIISAFDKNIKLVNEQQMRQIIRENCDSIEGGGDSHSMLNSIKLKNGSTYVVRDVYISSLIHEYCRQESVSKMKLRIE